MDNQIENIINVCLDCKKKEFNQDVIIRIENSIDNAADDWDHSKRTLDEASNIDINILFQKAKEIAESVSKKPSSMAEGMFKTFTKKEIAVFCCIQMSGAMDERKESGRIIRSRDVDDFLDFLSGL